jgi:hypothetical protein
MLPLVAIAVLAGERMSLPDKVFGAARVVEFTLTYGSTKPSAAATKILFPPESVDPAPGLKIGLTATSPCLKAARKKKQVKLLAFFDAEGRQLVGVEQDLGQATDLDPSYPALVEAVVEAKRWHDERMRAVGVEQLWQPQKNALASSNAYLKQLAASFLVSHGAAEWVDAAWGALGSAQRKKREAAAPTFVCR